MRNYRTYMDPRTVLDTITCDVCKKEFRTRHHNNDVTPDEDMEVQEFHSIDFVGGYGSIFGDEVTVNCDICQHCLKKILGEYLRIDKREYSG